MTTKTITEVYGKGLLARNLSYHVGDICCVAADAETNWDELARQHPWLSEEAIVIKPDQGIKRRGKLGLLKINTTLDVARKWIQDKSAQEIQVDGVTGRLRQFIIEPFIRHDPKRDEFFLSIYSELENDVIMFHHQGGVDVGDVDEVAKKMLVGLSEETSEAEVTKVLLDNVHEEKKGKLSGFIVDLLRLYRELHFAFLEINPLVVLDRVYVLDLAAQLDTKATPMCKERWGKVQFPRPFGRLPTEEERFVSTLEIGTPANVKLTLLNRKARIWSAISGGGISLLLGDTARQIGLAHEIGCYAQFSGPLNPVQMYGFTKTVLDLMLAAGKHPKGKVVVTGSQAIDVTTLLANQIGPGVGMMKALKEYKEQLIDHKVSIFIRSTVGIVDSQNEVIPPSLAELGIPVHVFGGEVPVADMIRYALEGVPERVNYPRVYRVKQVDPVAKINIINMNGNSNGTRNGHTRDLSPDHIFTPKTRAILIGGMPVAVQGIVGFDYVCSREQPSIAAIVRPNCEHDEEICPWGEGEVSIPVYKSVAEALTNHQDVTVVLNQGIGPVALKAAIYAINQPQVQCIVMMVGHISERQTRQLILLAREKNVLMIGPSSFKHGLQVNVLKPGSFRCNLFGDIGGPLTDVVSLKMYRQGSVVYLSRSGGLSTELCVSINRNTDGLYMGISLGGGTYTATGFMDHVKFFHNNPRVKCFILIGEVGGLEEYEVCEAIKKKQITKPVIAFCIGTSADEYKQEPAYFGHSGGGTDSALESAVVKNEALAAAGAIVPGSFDSMAIKLAEVYDRLAAEGKLSPIVEPPVPTIPANMKPQRRPPVVHKY